MYFQSREEAGKMLAERVYARYASMNSAVLALDEGGVVIGEEIAKRLHSSLNLILTEPIKIPGESTPIGSLDYAGRFTYNSMMALGYIEHFTNEYHNYINDQKLSNFYKMNRILGRGGFINERVFHDHVVFIVSDGLKSGASFDAAMTFLKPIKVAKIVALVAVASVPAVDRLHILSDELYSLGVTDNFLDVNHYYEQNELPEKEAILDKINNISVRWDR